MERLPPEINTKILIGFPIKTLCQLKCVSKSFNTFLKSHRFTKLHYDRQSSSASSDKRIKKKKISSPNSLKLLLVAVKSNLRTLTILDNKLLSLPLFLRIPSKLINNLRCPTRLVGSCMGLVCLRSLSYTYSLLNPTTREFRVLPGPGTFSFSGRPPIRLSGFGYVPLLDDFMVVLVAIYEHDGVFPPVIRVYSAKSDSWKTMGVGVEVPLFGLTCHYSVYVNGVAYWLGWSHSGDIDGNYVRVCKIMGFDFAKEEFSTLLLHENINEGEIKAFTVLDGCLCVLVRAADLSLEMWVMKEQGVVESWTKIFSFRRAFIKNSTSIFPICYAGNEILFDINCKLVLYDPVKNIATKLKAGLGDIKDREGRLDMARYEESLVSPYGYISQDERQITRVGNARVLNIAMERLPPEINTKILIGFSIKTLCQLKCVSKSFNTFLKSHHFTKLHHDQSSSANSIKLLLVAVNSSLLTLNILDHNLLSRPLTLQIPSNLVNNLGCPTRLVGSCMGLVCLRCPPNTYSLLNPTTREFRVLPDPGTLRFSPRPPIKLSGFGYVPLLDDFMVVSVAIYEHEVFPPVIKVYSTKGDSWKTMGVGVEVPLYGFTCDYSVYVNGVAYWLGWSHSGDIDGNYLRVYKIMGFDFAKEEFSTMLLHENINQREIKAFAVLDGCLCVLVRDADLSLGMWVMKERGVVESWTKIFSFGRAFTKPPTTSIFPICDAGNEVLFQINCKLVLYDPVKNIATKLKDGLQEIRVRKGSLGMARFEESLVSPYGYIGQDKRQITRVENEGVNNYNTENEYPPCTYCKKTNHPQIKCWWRPDVKCTKCGQLGHVERICKSEDDDKSKEAITLEYEDYLCLS